MIARDDSIERADRVLDYYRGIAGRGDDRETISDLLTDLMHLVERLNSDRIISETFDALADNARYHYEYERKEK